MATAHHIRDLITQTTSGTLRARVPREVRDEARRYAARRRREGAPWAVIAWDTELDARKLGVSPGKPQGDAEAALRISLGT